MVYRADIDGLRGVAVLLVLVFHFDLLGLGSGGFIGVDIFFVMSGYLISTMLWRGLSAGNFSLTHFYAQRVRRLAPALFAVQLAVFCAAFFTLLPSETMKLGMESALAQLYVSNIYYWQSLNYFGGKALSSFMLHSWSLGVEEQFYLVYPFVLIAAHRFVPSRLVLVLITLTFISFALNVAMVHQKAEATFYLLPTRAWEMLLGGLLSRLDPRMTERSWLRSAAGPLAVTLLLLALFLYRPSIPFPGWFALLPAFAAALTIFAGSGSGSTLSRLLARSIPVQIGKISYPLYLVHWPINVFAVTLLPHYDLPIRWCMFALSFASAFLIYRWVETGIRRGARLRGDRKIFVAYVSATALVLVIVASDLASSGWRFRYGHAVLNVADVAGQYDPVEQRLDYNGGAIDPWLRRVGAFKPVPHWLIVGDSHAGALAEAASRWLADRNEAGYVVYRHGCLPVLNSGDGKCRALNSDVLRYVHAHRNISAVMLISIWRQPTEARFTDSDGHSVSGSAAITAFDDALHKTLGALHSEGVKTYVWEPLPAMSGDVPNIMARNAIFGTSRTFETSWADHNATFVFLRMALDHDASLIAGRVRPDLTMCASGVCKAGYRGQPLFEDNNHPAFSQAFYFAKIFARGMLRAPLAADRPLTAVDPAGAGRAENR